MLPAAGSNHTRVSAQLRRFWSRMPLRYIVLALGLLAMTIFTVPAARTLFRTELLVWMWCCLGFFGAELVARIKEWTSRKSAAEYICSPAGIIDLLTVLPVPIALFCGVEPQNAWLLASLWVLKLAQESPGFAQLGRVFVLQARPLRACSHYS